MLSQEGLLKMECPVAVDAGGYIHFMMDVCIVNDDGIAKTVPAKVIVDFDWIEAIEV